ncbi:PQQ-binding-like beta-propeller repeat protein, partial [bacterium]|nr:PQQ-binding-like beta-propeller repeat protein [bacterium]
PAPAVERDGVLYFFDQGVLTAFELDTGNVRWRLASVGISRLDFDEDGQLYVNTTSAGVESIQYSQQVNLRDRTQPVILKVNPATGQVRWKAEDQGSRFLLSGRYLFFTRVQVSALGLIAAVSKGESAPEHFRLYRVDPDSGKILWEYYRQVNPSDLAVHQNRILLVFPERLELLQFLSW